MLDDRDDMIERVRAVLRQPPQVDASAKARVLVAVAAERERARAAPRRATPRARWAAASAAVAASLLLAGWYGVTARDRARIAVVPAPAAVPTAATLSSSVGAPVTMAADRNGESAALRPVQLVFRRPAAQRVSVVGDFTDWDATRAPMTRDSASGLWSVTLALRPGRHVYAFVVDDTTWVPDPRAMVAHDADFGRPGSVLLVGGR